MLISRFISSSLHILTCTCRLLVAMVNVVTAELQRSVSLCVFELSRSGCQVGMVKLSGHRPDYQHFFLRILQHLSFYFELSTKVCGEALQPGDDRYT